MQQRGSRLEGKVALVTGAGSSGPGVGTGKATSILFAREGARVLLVDMVAKRAEETLATIREEGGEASVFEADVTKSDHCRAMVDAAVERYGGLHILFNNAAINGRGTVVDMDEEVWDRVLEVNLKGMMLTSKYAIPRMIQDGGGSIINVSSIIGIRAGQGAGTGYYLPYSVSKGGIIALTTQMAVQHGRDNVRVNCIAPVRSILPSPPLSCRTRCGTCGGGLLPWAQRVRHGTSDGRQCSWPATRPAGSPAWCCRWTLESLRQHLSPCCHIYSSHTP